MLQPDEAATWRKQAPLLVVVNLLRDLVKAGLLRQSSRLQLRPHRLLPRSHYAVVHLFRGEAAGVFFFGTGVGRMITAMPRAPSSLARTSGRWSFSGVACHGAALDRVIHPDDAAADAPVHFAG